MLTGFISEKSATIALEYAHRAVIAKEKHMAEKQWTICIANRFEMHEIDDSKLRYSSNPSALSINDLSSIGMTRSIFRKSRLHLSMNIDKL